MRKYTANYAFTNPNFVVQNFVTNEHSDESEKALLFVLRNLLQRGFPTILSKFLQNELGKLHSLPDFKKPFLLVSPRTPNWVGTIKGDEQQRYFPARDFFERILPASLGEWKFIQPLLLPEAEINEITGIFNEAFINQRVDFFLPQAKLVLEIDGQQHKQDNITRVNDGHRDRYLLENGIKTIRISTHEFRRGEYGAKIQAIKDYLSTKRIASKLKLYEDAFNQVSSSSLSEETIRRKLIPTAIIRLQLLLIDCLLNQYLSFKSPWRLNIIIPEDEPLNDFATLAIKDLFIWYGQLYQLKQKEDFVSPEVNITYGISRDTDFNTSSDVLNIDFSLFQRWTDEHEQHPDLLFVRTDYYGAEANYFKVSCTKPIQYSITDTDKPVLEFFLENIFEKPSFRDGQFPIISNALNQEDTIGLLPTGGGKSMCYQLPCLLQPSINFVVCPIKSLMYDQQLNMKAAYVTNTNALTGDLRPEEKEQVQIDFAAGKYLFIWISPERFQIKTFREYIASVSANFSIAYAVIDEVHCMSEWGHDFRTSYLNLTRTIQRYCSGSKFIGLTATASVNVLKDIRVEFARNQLDIGGQNIKSLLDYSREELEFEIIVTNDKFRNIKAFLEETGVLDQKEDTALIFTPHVNGEYGCYSLSNRISIIKQGKASWYSGEVPKFKTSCFVNEHELNNPVFLEERIRDTLRQAGAPQELSDSIIETKAYTYSQTRSGNYRISIGNRIPVLDEVAFKKHKTDIQLRFKRSEIPLLVATKAFGMGIDKDNIKYTVHYGIPGSVESLYQEAGRAGRWTDKNKKAKCKVLYTPETIDKAVIDKIFEKQVPVSEIKAIFKNLGWNEGKDMVKNLQLSLKNQRDIVQDFKLIKLIVERYFRSESKEMLWFERLVEEVRALNVAESEKGILDIVQKSIYRLRLLGIVDDWTTDFNTHFEVHFISNEDKHILEALEAFLIKYKADIDLQAELNKLQHTALLDRAIWLLLQWSYENIAYSRRQSLKTLVEYCDDFKNSDSESFKKRIDNYFQFTETTFVYQHIGEHPSEYKYWFEVFFVEESVPESGSRAEEKSKIFIPAIKDEGNRKAELERLRDSLSRFLESHKDNAGLNFASGMIRLFLDDYEDKDGRLRLEQSLHYVEVKFSQDVQEEILKWMLDTGNFGTESQKENLAHAIISIYPERLEAIADYYGLFYLLDSRLVAQLERIKQLNQQLYEELEQIRTL